MERRASPRVDPLPHLGGLAAAALFAAAAVATGVAVEGGIRDGAALLDVLAEHRRTFLLANGLGIAAQLATVPFLVGLARAAWLDPGRRPHAVAWWAAGAGALAASSAAHLTYGLVPARIAAGEYPSLAPPASVPDAGAVVGLASTLHHLGDALYFTGIVGLALALLALAGSVGRDERRLGGLAVATAACHLGQLGWLVGLEPLQLLGLPGLVGQVVVWVLLARRLGRADPDPDPGAGPAGGTAVAA